MKFKKGDKVKIIQRKPGNVTGSENCGKPNGDVGSIGSITEINRYSSYCVEDGRKYYGWFDKDDLELVTNEFILPEKWCVKVGDPATKSVFDKWRRSNTTYGGYSGSVGYLNQNGFFSSEKLNMGVEMTFEQFKAHVLKETMEPKQEDLTGRWLKALVNCPQSTDCKKDEYVRIKSMRSDTSASGYTVVLDDAFSFGATPSEKDLWELMPEGFDPDEPTKTEPIPEYVKCTVTWMNNHTLETIYKVYKDGYVENNHKEKSSLSWNGGGFEKSTKEAYDAQQDPNVFKAGTYIVLLASCDGKDCWKSSMPINHCYILKRDSHSLDIHIELDAQGSTNNGWSCGSYYDSKMKIRAATPEEIAEYDRLGKPYDVTTLGKVKGEVDMKDIQRQCKEKYPIGSIVEDITYSIEHCLEDDGCIYSIHGNQIYSIMGKGLLYDNGKWATLVSLPESKKSESLLEEAKRRYPVGTKFHPSHARLSAGKYCIITSDSKFIENEIGIYSKITTEHSTIYEKWVDMEDHPQYGNTPSDRYVYTKSTGKWAEILTPIVESKPEKWIPKVGDWVVSLQNVAYHRNKGDVFQVLKLVNDSCIYYKEGVNGNISGFKPAEPHEIPKLIPKYDHLPMTEPHEYTPQEALAELKRRGFKKGVKYVYMYENGKYDEKDIQTATHDPCIIEEGDYIDCGHGYLWSSENPSHLHRGVILNPCAEIFLTVPSDHMWGQPSPITPNYLDPASLLPKIKLPI